MAGSVLTCVAYHHFEAAPTDATRHLGISTPPDVFRSHLDYYQLHFNVVELDARICCAPALTVGPLLIV